MGPANLQYGMARRPAGVALRDRSRSHHRRWGPSYGLHDWPQHRRETPVNYAEPSIHRLRAIGPAMHPYNREAGGDVMTAARSAFGELTNEVISPDDTGKWTFDPFRANVPQLLLAGVPADRIHESDLSTGVNTQFYGYRAQPRGRFAAPARLKAESQS